MNGKSYLLKFLLFLLLPSLANAQTKKKAWIVNLEGIAYNYDFFDNTIFFAGLEMELGYAVTDDLFIGGSYLLNFQNSPQTDARFEVSQYGIFGKYYFLQGKNRLFANLNIDQSIFPSWSSIDASAGFGYARMLSENTALEINFAHTFYQRAYSNDGFDSSGEGEYDILQPRIGFTFFVPSPLNRKKSKDSAPLSERYFLPGNSFLLAGGRLDFKDIGFLLDADFSHFVKGRRRLRFEYNGIEKFRARSFKIGVSNFAFGLDQFSTLAPRLFLQHGVSAGYSVISYSYFDFDFSILPEARLAVNYFLPQTIIEAGGLVQYSFPFGGFADPIWISDLHLSTEFFILEKLSISATYHYPITGYNRNLFLSDIDGFARFRQPRFHLKLGHYF